ncbi:Altered inheritance of mitochondria protein 32 [Rhizina undulata]
MFSRSRALHTTRLLHKPAPISIPFVKPAPATTQILGITEKCPEPTCDCEASPAVDLEIDRTTPLMGTMANYYRHCLISTGKNDWNSKIEFDVPLHGGEAGGLAAKLKEVSARKGGNLRDPFAPTLTTNSSFRPSPSPTAAPTPLYAHGSAYIFPSNYYIPYIPLPSPPMEPSDTAHTYIASLIRGFLLPSTANPPQIIAQHRSHFPGVRRVTETVVLICSHHSRDPRCGIMAPVLKSQFEKILSDRGILLTPIDEAACNFRGKVRVGYTSHMSGHKFAGNVIVYLPPSPFTDPEIPKMKPVTSETGPGFELRPEEERELSSAAEWEGQIETKDEEERGGVGVWYGRVEPKHVQGIVEETVVGRRLMLDLCRGVVGTEGKLDLQAELGV